MKDLIIKYTIVLIICKLIYIFIPDFIITTFPSLQFYTLSNGASRAVIGPLTTGMHYFLNLIMTILLFREMQILNIKSLLILIITLFSSITGVIFFLFIVFDRKYNTI